MPEAYCRALCSRSCFNVYIFVACLIKPEWGPALPPEERASWREKFVALKAVILPIVLDCGNPGKYFYGGRDPQRGGGLGGGGNHHLFGDLPAGSHWPTLRDSFQATLRLSCMVMWIIFGASVFTAFYTAIGAQDLTPNILRICRGVAGGWLSACRLFG